MGIPLAAIAAIKGIPALYQLGTGIQQGIRARRLARKTKRPTYEIPKEIMDNQRLAKNAYGASSMYGIPGQGRIQANMDQSQANSVRGITMSQQSPSAQLLGMAALDANSKSAANNLGIQSANFRQQNMDNSRRSLMSTNNILAQYRDKAFEYNKAKPFEATMAAISALRNGAIQNTYGALNSAAGIVGGVLERKKGGTGSISGGASGGGGINSGQTNDFGSYYGQEIDRLRSLPQFAGMDDETFYSMFGNQGIPK